MLLGGIKVDGLYCPLRKDFHTGVAQLVEQRIPNPQAEFESFRPCHLADLRAGGMVPPALCFIGFGHGEKIIRFGMYPPPSQSYRLTIRGMDRVIEVDPDHLDDSEEGCQVRCYPFYWLQVLSWIIHAVGFVPVLLAIFM